MLNREHRIHMRERLSKRKKAHTTTTMLRVSFRLFLFSFFTWHSHICVSERMTTTVWFIAQYQLSLLVSVERAYFKKVGDNERITYCKGTYADTFFTHTTHTHCAQLNSVKCSLLRFSLASEKCERHILSSKIFQLKVNFHCYRIQKILCSDFRSALMEGATNVSLCACMFIWKADGMVLVAERYSDWYKYLHRFASNEWELYGL